MKFNQFNWKIIVVLLPHASGFLIVNKISSRYIKYFILVGWRNHVCKDTYVKCWRKMNNISGHSWCTKFNIQANLTSLNRYSGTKSLYVLQSFRERTTLLDIISVVGIYGTLKLTNQRNIFFVPLNHVNCIRNTWEFQKSTPALC